ncbi:hypothetical protein D3C85_946070 [compost metagenome]
MATPAPAFDTLTPVPVDEFCSKIPLPVPLLLTSSEVAADPAPLFVNTIPLVEVGVLLLKVSRPFFVSFPDVWRKLVKSICGVEPPPGFGLKFLYQ